MKHTPIDEPLDHGIRHERIARNRGPLRRFLSELAGLRRADARLYWLCRLTGRSFTEYYAARMDRIAARSPDTATGRPDEKRFQLEYLRSQGMSPDSSLLDYGCGAGSAAVNFVSYLQSQRYTGADISQSCLDVAQQRIVEHQLTEKQPEFVHLDGGSVESLSGRTFDFIWAQSVMTHMPPENIGQLLQALIPLMHANSRFYATFAYTEGSPVHHRYKDWYYNPSFFHEVSNGLPLNCSMMADWTHPHSPIDRMVCFQRNDLANRAAA